MAFKIFKKTNYIYIVDTETDQLYEGLAKDVRFNRRYVDDTLFYINGMGDFPNTTEVSFSNILDENGDEYTDLATFVAWYEDNTGFSGGGSTPETTYIPLTGTEEGNPISGKLEFLYDGNWKKIYSKNIDGEEFGLTINTEENCVTIYKIFSDNTSVFNRFGSSDLNYYATFGVGYKEIELNAIYGIVAAEDYSEVLTESKLIYAQRSYVEKPETLINALNNCDETQLGVIKGILGIT